MEISQVEVVGKLYCGIMAKHINFSKKYASRYQLIKEDSIIRD